MFDFLECNLGRFDACLSYDDARKVGIQKDYLNFLYQEYELTKSLSRAGAKTLHEFLCAMVGNLLESMMMGRLLSVNLSSVAPRHICERAMGALEAEGLIERAHRGYFYQKQVGGVPNRDATKLEPHHKVFDVFDPTTIKHSRAWCSVVRSGDVTKNLNHRKGEHEILTRAVKAFQPRVNIPLRKLTRIFSGDESTGGRIYCNYQQMPSAMRSKITVDKQPSVELDYPANQIKMIFRILDVDSEDDPYSGFEVDRGQAKKAMNILINANSPERVLTDSRYAAEFRWSRQKTATFIQTVCDRYPIFKQLIGSGLGIHLQRVEGDIALEIMSRALHEGLVALPVHDSFIVSACDGEWLDQVMFEVWGDVVDRSRDDIIDIIGGINGQPRLVCA